MSYGILIHVLCPPPSQQILFGFCDTEASDNVFLEWFGKALRGVRQHAILDALSTPGALPFQLKTDFAYDVINPFGDRRQIHYRTVWIFDISRATLFLINKHHRAKLPFRLLQERSVTVDDLEECGPPVPPLFTPNLSGPYWKPSPDIDIRTRAYTHRLLRDFDHQWRHVIRNDFNAATLHVLAQAVVRLATLDFDVIEDTEERHHIRRSRPQYVWVLDLPTWKPFKSTKGIIRLGSAYLILCQSIEEGLSKARQATSLQDLSQFEVGSHPQYLILTMKHIVLARSSGPSSIEYTAPEPLFFGRPDTAPPTKLGLDYLIWATASVRRLVPTTLSILPVEVQDLVLSHTAAGTVASAKIGCTLGLGSEFSWKDGNLDVALCETYTFRSPFSPVESQIWFDGKESGIIYKGM